MKLVSGRRVDSDAARNSNFLPPSKSRKTNTIPIGEILVNIRTAAVNGRAGRANSRLMTGLSFLFFFSPNVVGKEDVDDATRWPVACANSNRYTEACA